MTKNQDGSTVRFMVGKESVVGEKKYNPHTHSYQGKDNREGRLHETKTDRGTFRVKSNHRDD